MNINYFEILLCSTMVASNSVIYKLKHRLKGEGERRGFFGKGK
jgi:hypothetical protein